MSYSFTKTAMAGVALTCAIGFVGASNAMASPVNLGAIAVGDLVVQQAYFKASNAEAGDSFGYSVDLDGDTLVFGARQERSGAKGVSGDELDNSEFWAGAAYVFVRSGSTWVQQAYLKASNTGSKDMFGHAVAVSGDTIAVGARWEGSNAWTIDGDQTNNSLTNAGAVYVFKRTGTTWSQEAYIKPFNPDSWDNFGTSLDLSGDTLVVGAPDEDSLATGIGGPPYDNNAHDAGAAYVFVRNGSTWTQEAYLKASNSMADTNFGQAVGIYGDTIVVGATGERGTSTGVDGDQTQNGGSDIGAAYVFDRIGTTWSQNAYLKAVDVTYKWAGDKFGAAISIYDDRILVGAPNEGSMSAGIGGDASDNSEVSVGAAYLFQRNGGSWAPQLYIKASNPGPQSDFGVSVALGDKFFVVGSEFERGISVGINGVEANTGDHVGAAYAFSYTGNQAEQVGYIKASNAAKITTNQFGAAVALSGTEITVSTPSEGNDATGVDGNQFGGSANASGAGYHFDLAASCGVTRFGAKEGVNAGDLYSFDLPKVGSNVTLRLRGFDYSPSVFLFISLQKNTSPLFHGELLLDMSTVVLTLVLPIITGQAQLTLPISPALAGMSLYAQAGGWDPGQVYGVTMTNGLSIIVCP